jgi:Domain of unknown function (DUF4376)
MNTIYVSWQMYKESKKAHRNIKETLKSKNINATVEYLCEFENKKWAKITSDTPKEEIINALSVNQARELDASDNEMLKAHINNLYNLKRDVTLQDTFEWNGHVFDGDDQSYKFICSAVDLGLPQMWTLADNSALAVTAADLALIKQAMVEYGATVFQTYRTLKDNLAEMDRDQLTTICKGLQ